MELELWQIGALLIIAASTTYSAGRIVYEIGRDSGAQSMIDFEEERDALLQKVEDKKRLLHQCAWCRRIRIGETWQSYPEVISAVTHTICERCRDKLEKKKSGQL